MDPQRRTHAVRWGAFAMVVSVGLMIIKLTAYWLTRSTAILSDALESVTHILTSTFTLYAVWLSQMPRDFNHPYGHGRVEYFSEGLEGLLIAGAGVSIMIISIPQLIWLKPQAENLTTGTLITFVIGVLAWVTGTILMRAGRRNGWSSIEADGHHIRSDAITTFAAFAGLLLVMWLKQPWIDPAIAVSMACWLLWIGGKLLRHAVSGLMDEADPAQLDAIAAVLEANRQPGWVAPHRGRVHRLGATIHMDLHLVFPRFWSLDTTHLATDALERALCDRFGEHTEAMIHMEPCTDRSCSYCDLSDCPIRSAPFSGRNPWRGQDIALIQRQPPNPDAPDPPAPSKG
jgi:cation diffusion facilitator family transporter